MSIDAESSARSESIRRRIEREYVVVTAPRLLDGASAGPLFESLFRLGDDCDLVLDLRPVEGCEPGIVDALDRAAAELARLGTTLTLSHPSPAAEAVLDDRHRTRAFEVRRPREPRPVRRSLRGQL